MASRTAVDGASLILLTAFSRFLTRSHVLYDIDSVNFALALDHFDPRAHQPHPPGYFLYVLLGRLFRLFTGDSNNALVAISIAASCLTVWLVYLLGRHWFGRRPALLAGALFLVSPLAWFHGTVALTYMVEASFSAATGYLCWRAYKGSNRHAYAAAALLGLAAGFRQSSMLLLAPLLLFATVRMGRRQVLILLTASCATLAWFLPMLYAAGGFRTYFSALWDLWRIVPGNASLATSGLILTLARTFTVGFLLLLSFGLGILVFPRAWATLDSPRRRFVAAWITPSLLFFTLVFLKFVNGGYLLLITPPLFILLGHGAALWLASTASPFRRLAAATAVPAAGLLVYFFAPLYCSYGEVRNFEQQLNQACSLVRSTASPGGTLVVGFDSHFLGYRHAAYYLPEYLVVQYPEVRYPSGTLLFLTTARRTQVVRRFEVNSYARAVFFPLPPAPEYQEFRDRVLALVPQADRRDSGPAIQISPNGLRPLFPLTMDFHGVYTTVDTPGASANHR